MQNFVVKHRSGESYKVMMPRENVSQITIKAERFRDEGSAHQFVNNLMVSNGYWHDIVNQCGSLNSSCAEFKTIEQQVSALIVHDKIKFYPIQVLDIVAHPPEKRAIKSDDMLYRFEPSSSLLFNNSAETKNFKDLDEAFNFLSDICESEEQLSLIAKELSINIPSTAYLSSGEITDTVSKELVSGNVVIIADKSTSTPPKEKEEEENKSTVGNRAVILADEKQDNTQNKNICSCSVEELNLVCSHNRSASSDNVLQVVASTDKSHFEEYELMGVKITLKKDFGGVENVTGTTSLKDNQSSGCFQITDINSKYITSNESLITIESNESDTSSKWPINASPNKTWVSSKGCDGKVKKSKIEEFPNQYYTAQVDISIFKDWADNVNKGWEKWAKKFFDVSPIELTPKITGPTGSFSANWGWKENQDWRAYYNVSCDFGLKPILGVELALMISMGTLAATAAGLPPNVAKMASEHIADLRLSVAVSCHASLAGQPAGKFFADGSKEVTGEAKFTSEGAVKLKALFRVGSKYIVAAEIAATGQAKLIGDSLSSLDKDGLFIETILSLKPFVGIASIKTTAFVIMSKTKEKKWEPWPAIEIYKSDKIKVLPR